jgi:hypothetical protein
MNSGLIEYFAVTEYGKTHEAVVVLGIQPMHLQLGLLLLGLEYGQNLGFQGDTVMPLGDSVYIYLGWLDENQDTTIYEISELIVDYQNNQPMPSTAWIFTGSFLHDGHYMADMDGSIIATYSDPVAILNNPLSGRMDDTVYDANEKLLPPAGKPVFMKIITRQYFSYPHASKGRIHVRYFVIVMVLCIIPSMIAADNPDKIDPSIRHEIEQLTTRCEY